MDTPQTASSQLVGGTGAAHILLIHGPNLNLLGVREPHLYGAETLEQINRRLSGAAQHSQMRLSVFQSNSEGSLVDRVHQARGEGVAFIVINPAAYTHT
ncbi:MAG: type II 3-dehydroquinate dehydratase, partial [Burkholderiales bacterium]|nr:type II 3-dehydroquinate dehydratase [Burkholderiales bacterium]